MPLIVLPHKKSHIPGYRSIEKELGWFFLLHTNFLGVLGLCVYKCGHSGKRVIQVLCPAWLSS